MVNKPLSLEVNELGRTRAFKDAEFLFQVSAREQIESILARLVARTGELSNLNGAGFEELSQRHLHQNIFIDGNRGTGKTTFLVNIGRLIERSPKLCNNLVCLAPLDPTQSSDRLSFLWDVIARTKSFLEERNANLKAGANRHSTTELKRAIAELDDAVEAYLEQQSVQLHEKNVVELRQYEIALEQSVDRFFEEVCHALNCKALVLPIDDIDLADNKTFAFNVLDVLRLYLSTPRLVPVVAGNFRNYQILLENKFFEVYARPKQWEYKFENETKELTSQKEIQREAGSLADAYLDKIFPTPHRIRLVSISDLLTTQRVELLFAANDESGEKHKVVWDDFVRWYLKAQYEPWLWAVPEPIRMNEEFHSVRSFLAYVNRFQDVIRHYSVKEPNTNFVSTQKRSAQAEYLYALKATKGFGRLQDIVVSLDLTNTELPSSRIPNSALVISADILGIDRTTGNFSSAKTFRELVETLPKMKHLKKSNLETGSAGENWRVKYVIARATEGQSSVAESEPWLTELMFQRTNPFQSSYVEMRTNLFLSLLETLNFNRPDVSEKYGFKLTDRLQREFSAFSTEYEKKNQADGNLPLAGAQITAYSLFNSTEPINHNSVSVKDAIKGTIKSLTKSQAFQAIDPKKSGWVALARHPFFSETSNFSKILNIQTSDDLFLTDSARYDSGAIQTQHKFQAIKFYFSRPNKLRSLLEIGASPEFLIDFSKLNSTDETRFLLELNALDHPFQTKYRAGNIPSVTRPRLKELILDFWSPFSLRVELMETFVRFHLLEEN
jgi:hypothetical protein